MMEKRMKFSLIGCVFMLFLVNIGTAQTHMFETTFTYPEILDSMFSIRAGVWFQEIDGDFLFDQDQGDTEVDFENDLGLNDNDDISLRAEIQPWQKHHFRLGYNGIEFDGDRILERTIRMDGEDFVTGNRVITELEMDAYEIAYRYDLFRGEQYVLAPIVQVNVVDFDIQARDITTGGGGEEGGGDEGAEFVFSPNQYSIFQQDDHPSVHEDVIVPLPMIGLHGEYFPHPRLGLFAEIKGFTIGDTASVIDFEFGGQVNVVKNFSIVAGYRYMDFDFDISDAILLANGDMLILERKFSYLTGVAIRIRRIKQGAIAPGALVDGEEIFIADMAHEIDNLEAMAVHRAATRSPI